MDTHIIDWERTDKADANPTSDWNPFEDCYAKCGKRINIYDDKTALTRDEADCKGCLAASRS